MHQRLRIDYGLVVSRETVRLALKMLDPEGVERRSQHKLKRRTYSARGPNFIWHLDGYDKLKPFGLCVHGAIDGYSRRILWLEVGSSNNNPRIVARYFLDCVKQLGGVPQIARGDRDTENVNVAAICSIFLGEMRQTQWLERKVSFMGAQSLIKGLKLGGLFYARMILIGGSIFLKILEMLAYTAMMIHYMWSVYGFAFSL